MKKFMIFLLMAFLYLGTSQARSEAPHFSNAKAPLLSWVTPSSHSFFADSKAVNDVVVTVSPSAPQSMGLNVPSYEIVYGATVTGLDGSTPTYRWYINGNPTDSVGPTFRVSGYPAGTYNLYCKVNDQYSSNTVIFTVSADVTANIVGPRHACQNDVVTLTAMIENSSDVTVNYQWKHNGDYIPGATSQSYSFIPANLPGLANDTLAHEFSVEITRSGCESSLSPVHYFTVSPTPVTQLTATQICPTDPIVLTANSYTSGNEQPWKWEWYKNGSHIATTYVNTYEVTEPNAGDKYVVLPVYQDFACNDLVGDTVTITPTTVVSAPTIFTQSEVCEIVNHTETQEITTPIRYYTPCLGMLASQLFEIAYPDWTMDETDDCAIPDIHLWHRYYKDFTETGTIEVTIPELVCTPAVSNDTVCAGSTVTVTATPADAASYIWYMDGVEVSGCCGGGHTLSQLTYTFDTPGIHYFQVKAVSASGCESELSNADTVVVEAPRMFAITGNNVLCDGDTATLTATAIGVEDYTWYGPVTGTGRVLNNATAGTYMVVGTSEHGCIVASEPFTVYNIGTDLQVIASATNVCAGEHVTLNANISDLLTGNVTYAWSTGSTNPTIDVVPTAALHSYTVTATYGNCTNSASIDINVNTAAAAPSIAGASTLTICQYAQQSFSVSNPATGASYTWYVDGVEVAGATLATFAHAFNEPGNHEVRVSVTSAEGCTSAVSSAVTVTVETAPTIMIAGDALICNNDFVVLTANINDYNHTFLTLPTDVHYEWRISNVTVENQLTLIGEFAQELSELIWNSDLPIFRYQLPAQDQPYVITVVATSSANGCTTVSDPYYVYVSNDINVNVTLDYNEVCAGGMVTATAHLADYNTPNLVYQWSVNGVPVAHGTERIFTTPVTADNTVISVVVTQTTSGCTATGSAIAHTFNPSTVHSVVAINGMNEADQVCEGAEITVTAYLDQNHTVDPNLTYVWTENGHIMPNTHGYRFSKQVWALDHDPVDYIYTAYVYTDVPGCAAVPVSSDTVHVRRNPMVVLDGMHNICFTGVEDINLRLLAYVDGTIDPDATYTFYRNGQQIISSTIYGNLLTENIQPTHLNPYTYLVEVTNGNGCSSFSDPFVVEVYDAPVVNILASDTVICYGGEVQLQARINNYNDPMLTYQWYANHIAPVDLLPGRTLPYETFQVNTTTDYIVEVTHLLQSSQNNVNYCSDRDTITVRVIDDPVVIISTNIPTDHQICEGQPVKIVATVQGGVTGTEIFSWFRNGELIQNITGDTLVDFPQAVNGYPTTYTYEVSVSQRNSGCISVLTFVDTVVVNPNPTVAIETDPIVCGDGANNVKLFAHVSPAPATPYTFNWFEDNVALTGATGVHLDTLILTKAYRDYPYNFSVSLVNDYGCQAVAETQVYVDTVPVINVTATDADICVGGTVTLTAHLNNWNTTNMQYQWYEGNNPINGATDLTYTVSPTELGAHNYKFTALQLNSHCAAASEFFTVTVHHDPVIASVTLSDTIVCQGAQIMITANLDANTPASNDNVYTWYRNGILMPGAVAQTIYDSPVTVDNNTQQYIYSVTVATAMTGCVSAPATSAALTVYPNPTVVITGDQFVCATDSVFLQANTDSIGTDVGLLHYTWYESGMLRDNMAYTLGDNQFYAEYWYPRDEPYRFVVEVQREGVPAGCAARSAEYLVYVLPVPDVNITATETEICTGGEVTLTANLVDPNAQNIIYQWYEIRNRIDTFVVGYSGGQPTYFYAYTPYRYDIPGANSRTYTAVYTDTTKVCVEVIQTTSQCHDIDSVLIIVNPDPTIDVTSDLPTTRTLCDGRSVTFTATVEGGVAGGEVFTWYRNGEVIPNAVGAVFTETPHAISNYPTVYVYEVSVKQTANGCESIVTLADTVTVNPNPTLAIETDPIVCSNNANNITMVAHVYPEPTTDYTFTWFEDNAVITGATGAHLDTITLTKDYRDYPYNFSISLVNEYGCQATAETVIYVDTVPVINIVATETQICAGGEITLTANLNNWNTPNMQYQWYDNGNAIAGATSLTYTVVPTQEVHNYTFTAKQLNSLCQATSNTVTVNVNLDPTIVVNSDLPTSNTLCDGRSVTFTATVSGGVTGGEIFTWYRNGEVIPGAVSAVYTETPHAISDYPTVYVYEVSVKQTAAGCESIVTLADTVTVNPNPTVTIQTDPIVCGDNANNITMIANILPEPTTNYTFAWYEENVALTGATGAHLDTIVLTRPYRDYPYNFSVVLVNEYGCQATAETSIYVDSVPVINIVATETQICRGGEITLTANLNNWNTANMEYQWYDNGNAIAGATSLTYTVIPTDGNHAYTFTAKQLNSLCQATSNTVDVTVNPDPTIVVNSDLPPTRTLCDGRSVTFTATVAGGVTGGEIFTWYRNGEVIPNAVGAIFTETVHAISDYPTVYVYEVSVKQTAAGCESIVTLADTVTVNPNPTLAIEADPIVCGDGANNITMVAHVYPEPTTNYTFTWFEDNRVLSGATGPHDAMMVLTRPYRDYPYNFSVSLVNQYGCQATAETVIYVDTVPVVNIAATETEICVGGEITLTANLNNWNTPNMQYQWYDNGSVIAGATSLTYTVVPTSGAHAYTFTAEQLNSLCHATSNTVTVNVANDPTIVVNSDLPPTRTLCDGRSVTFTATVAGGVTGGEIFTWYRNGEVIPNAVGAIFTETVHAISDYPTVYVYEVSVKQTAAGCESIVTLADTVTVNPNPTLAIEADPIVCGDGANNITMVAHVYPEPTTNYTFTWFEDNRVLSGATGPHDAMMVLTRPYRDYPYNFSVSLVNQYGCQATAETVIYVDTVPVVNIAATETEICVGGEITLTANLNNWNTPNMQYQWYDNGSVIAGATSLTYTVIPTEGTHAYTFTAKQLNSLCHATSNTVNVTVNPDPVVTAITINGVASDTLCDGAQVTLAATITPANANAVYTWYRNGIEIPGANQSTFSENVYTNDNQITVNVYTAKVVLPAAGCESAISTVHADAVIFPAPSNVSISGEELVCNLETTTLIATADGAYMYSWDGGPFTTDSSFQAGPGVHYVIAQSIAGCNSASNSFTVRSFGTDLQISATATSICEGEHVTLNADLQGMVDSNVVYIWSTTPTNHPTIDVQPDSTTTYTVTAMYDGCSNSASITILVHHAPATPTVVGPKDDILCEGEQAQFVASVAGTPAAVSYIWYLDGVEIPGENLNTLNLNLTAIGTHIINARAISSEGCISDVSVNTTITIEAAPSLLTITGNNIICYGDSTLLTAHAEGATTYQWSTGVFADHIYASAGVYTVTAYSANGCKTVSDPFTVNEFGPDVQITADQTAVCAGTPVVLNANEDGWVGNIVYTWEDGTHTSTHTVIPTTSGWHRVTSTVTSNGYDTHTCTRVDSIFITVYPLPVVNGINILGNDTICEGTQVSLAADPDSAASYRWFENGIEIPGHNLDTITVMPEPGVHYYAVQLINEYGCESAQHAISTPIVVLPNPTIMITGDALICNDSLITLYANINDTNNTNAQNALYNYEWRVYNYTLVPGGATVYTDPISGESYYVHPLGADSPILQANFPAQDHPYIFTVQATNTNGCLAKSDPYYVYVEDTIFVAVTVDHDAVCQGGEVTATAHLGNYNTQDLVYQWFKNGVLIPYATEPIFTTTIDEDSTVLTVTVTQTTTGCNATGSDTVYFFYPPQISAVTAVNGTQHGEDIYVCEGAQITVTAVMDSLGTTDSSLRYIWKENGFLMPLAHDYQFSKQMWILDHDSAMYTYEAYIDIDVPGCVPYPVYSNRVHVRRNPIVIIDGVHNVCFHDVHTPNVYLTAMTDGGQDVNAIHKWYRNGFLTYNSLTHDNMFIEMVEPTHHDPVTYMVEVINGNGCSSFSEPFQVEVYAAPVVNILASDTLICEGGEVELQARIDNYNDPMLVFEWYRNEINPGNLMPGRTHATEIFSNLTETTTFFVHVTHLMNDNSGGHTICDDYDQITIHVNPDPVVTLTNDLPDSKTLCDGRSVTFTTTVTGGVPGGEVFTWYRNGEIIPNAVGPQFTETPHAISDYPTTYIYQVSVKQATTGCESIVTVADTIIVNPNPTVEIETDPIVCRNDNGNIVMVAHVYPEPTTAYTFNWFEDNVVLTGATGAHLDTIVLTREYRDYPYHFSVSLVNEYGCQATDEAIIYVDTLPVINITSTEYDICTGGEITLTANLDNWNTPNMEYHWYDNNVLIPGATSLTYTVVPALGAHNYTFSAEQLNSHCSAISNVATVNVHADPTITVTNDLPASKTLCDGRSVTFEATVHGGVAGGEIFTWYRNGEVIPNAVGATFTETPHAISDYPTVYVYEVSVKQTANGCESVVTFADTVTVNPNPTLAIEADPIICGDNANNITMVAHVYPEPTTDYTFTWFEDNRVINGATGPHDAMIVLTRPYRDYPYNFSVSLVNEYGCQATAETQVYVDTIPVINITSTETEICVGGEITLTANLNNWNTPNMEYHWYDNNVEIPGATSLTYTVVPALGAHNYTFSAEQLNSHCSAISNVATVNVHADPTITVTNDLPASKTLCDGRSVTFEATVHGGVAGGEIFTWYRNGEVIPNAVGATFTETPHAISDYPTVYVYEVSVKQTANGCESVVTFADTVTVNPNPTLAIEADPIICGDNANNITMVAHVYPEPTTDYTFTWFEDNRVINGATGPHDAMIVLTRPYRDYPYNFSVSLVNEYGCQATAETQVYVDTIPVINITSTETEICVGGEITLTANLNNWNTPNMEYHWYDNNVEIAGATSLTYTVVPALGDHVYTFTAKQLNSLCHATSNAITVNVIPDPVIANVTLSDTIVCQGAQIAITANAGNYVPSTDDVYTWYRNGVLMPGATAQTIYDSPVTVDNNTQQYIYTAVVTRTPSGCTSLPVASAALTIYPNPTVVITGDQHVCETDSIFLIANVDTIGGNVGTLHYTWYESGMIRDNMAYGYGDNQFYGEYWYARVEPYRFTVEVQREGVAAACASTSAEYLVYVYPQPVVNITATETEICEGGEVTLTANLVDPNAQNMIYQWYEIRHRVDTFETGYDSLGNFTYTYFPITYHYDIPGANSATYTTTYNETITVGVVAFQTPSTCFDTDEITITVNPRPVVTSVTVNGVVLDTVCDGAQVNLAATINPADAQGAVYTWFRNGVEIPGANQSTFSENVYTNDNQVTTNVYTVMVTLPASGCVSEVSVPNATVVVNPAPSTVTISGNNVICEGDSTVLTVYSDVDGIITWSTGSHEPSITVPAGVYTVTVTTPEGCEKTSDPFTVEALGTDLLVSASETHICAGEHTTLYVNQDGWAGNVTYQWCAEAGNSTATTVDVHPDVTTTYTVTATVNSSNNIHGCTAVGEVTIIVTPLPTTLVVTGDTTICQGDQATLTASTTDSDITGYIWYQNGVEIPGENQAVLTINFPDYGTYTYVAKAVNNQGCVSAIASNPATVTVNPAPTTVSITGNNIICENDMTNLTVYSDVTGTITWSTGSHDANINVPAGVYTVTVTTPEGCEMTSAPFTVEALGTDLLVSASETHICAGEHTTLYVNQDGWAGNVTYQWSANAGNSVATTVDVAPEVTTTYTVTATVNSTNNMNGCTAIGEVTIVVTPLPAIVTVNASADSICEGEQVTFTATPADPTYTYIWYQNGIEIAGEHQNVITVNFPIEGAYTFAAKAVNPDGCESAEASAPVTVYVSAAPDAVVISGNLEICNGGTTTLYADVTPHVAGATYQWYQDNVAIAGATGYFLTVTTAGSYKVDVTTNGCTTTSDAVNVIVNEAPQLQLTATETTICQFGTTVISAEATGWNNNEVNYTWSNGYHGSSFTFTPTVAGDYTFSVTASLATSGCTAVDQITIHVNAAPAAPVVTVNNALVCDGGQITLTMTDTNTVNYGTPIITWYDNGAYMAGNQTSVTLTPALGQHTYNVSVEYPNSGCNTAISEVVVVNVIPQPTVAIELTSGNNNVLCDGGSTTLTANVTPAGFNYNYQWFQNNVEIPGATNSTLDVTLFARESTYDYQVVVTAAPGCIVVSDVTSITVVSDPVVVASVDNAIICEGGVATFSVAVDGGVSNVNGLNGYTYAWYSNLDHSTPIANTPTFTVNNATAGTYAYEVIVTSPYGCSTTSNVVVLNVVEDPTVTVAVAAGYDATICENGSTVLVANVTGGYGTPSYQWYSNGLPILGETNRTLVLNNVANNNFVYTVKVTQTGVDCEAMSTNTVNPFTVVAPYSVTVTGNANTCVGGTVTLTAAVTGVLPTDVPTYQWYRVSANGVATPIAGANSAVYTTEPLLTEGSYEYYVGITSSISGCTTNSDSYTANVIADPTVVINGAHSVCEQGQLQLNATVYGGIPGVQYEYTWTWTGASSGSAVTAVPTYTPNLPANDGANHYYFTVTVNAVGTSGCDATSAAHELDVYAVPTVTVTADRSYVCEGGAVTFTANVTPAGNYNYAWTINGVANAANTPSVTTIVNNAGPVSATVTVSANNNIVSCETTATIAVPVQTVADPVVTITANHTSMCAGGTTTLSVANIVVDNNIPADYSYQWAINGHEIPGAINNTFVQSLTDAGTYIYTLKITQNGNLGCSSDWSAPVTVLVAEQPVVTLNSIDGLNICEGGSITLNGVVDNYGNTVNGVLNNSVYGPMTYTWNSNGVVVQNGVHSNVNAGTDQLTQTLNNVGNYNYNVVVTPTGYACQPAASNIVTVNVLNDPTWTDVHVYYPDVCVGQQVNLEAAIVGGVADYNNNTNGYIQWTVTFNGTTANVAGGQGGNSYDFPAYPGNYVYTPTYVGNIGSGCQLTNTADVEQPVTVHEIPTAMFVTGDGSTICANDPDASVELTIVFTGGAPYTFDIENMMTGEILPYHVSLTDTFRFYVSPNVTTRYRIIALANSYCENNELGSIESTTVTVNVNAVSFSETTFTPVYCGEDVTISFDITSGNENEAYQVYENGALIASGTVIDGHIIIPDGLLSEGTHYLTLVIGGCEYEVTVIIPVGSEYSDIFGPNFMDIRWDDVVIINLNANPRYEFVGFQWYRNNELIPGAIYKNYQEIGGLRGFYSVVLTAIDHETGEMVTFQTCPREFNSLTSMKVYPVPATVQQVITIELDLTAEELDGAVLDIYDATGKLINHMSDLTPITKVAGFKAQGTYFGRIITGTNEIKTVKFVIVK